MAERPWFKFFPSDWRGEPRLRSCSIGARGLWIEMMCLAHDAEPYGHVLVNGKSPDMATLARLIGADASECETYLEELESAGVFSRTRKEAIYSRRMVRDAKKAKTARKVGRKGGNPSLSKQKGNPATDNPPLNRKVEEGVKPHMPEARVQKVREEDTSTTEGIHSESEPSRQRGAGAPDDGLGKMPDFLIRPANGQYAFEGRTVRLIQTDYERWRAAYPNIPDFDAELTAADDFYTQNPPPDGKWFFPVSRWLKRANESGATEPPDIDFSRFNANREAVQ